MQLHEKLTQLIGHQIFVINSLPGEDDGIPGGTLQEVGDDYLIVKSTGEDGCGDECGHATVGAEWIVALSAVVNIIHGDNCPKCVSKVAKVKKSAR